MRYWKRLVCFFALTACLAGCNRINPFTEGKVVARAGDKELYVSDLEGIIATGLSPQDSMRLLESYVNMWVRNQLKLHEAERTFKSSGKDIDALVEEYRQSLLTHKLDQHYINMRLDTLCSDESIDEYYEENKGEFTLDRAIVKGVVVRLPAGFRQIGDLKEMINSSGERYQDFLDISTKNEFELTEFHSWTDFSRLMALLPSSAKRDYENLLSKKGVSEFRSGDDVFLVCIREIRNTGEPSPRERIEDIIRQTLINKRKQEIIRSYEDSLLGVARSRNDVEIKIY